MSGHAPLVLEDGAARLLGCRCPSCGTHAFPPQASCARCGSATEEVPLPATGAVWSWTVQRTRPKPPYRDPAGDGTFEPYAVAYVDLGPLKVESRLDGRPVDGWGIGDAVRLTVSEQDGVPVHRFVPMEGAS